MEPKVNIAIKAARLAAKEIHYFYKRREKLTISEKAPVDFVTQVDKKVETILVDTIRESFPGKIPLLYPQVLFQLSYRLELQNQLELSRI